MFVASSVQVLPTKKKNVANETPRGCLNVPLNLALGIVGLLDCYVRKFTEIAS